MASRMTMYGLEALWHLLNISFILSIQVSNTQQLIANILLRQTRVHIYAQPHARAYAARGTTPHDVTNAGRLLPVHALVQTTRYMYLPTMRQHRAC
ncbi:uncharacterized protein IWZ02DRAFT_54498 [Phyllosticta citriasiana]|uniref:uncharacterized protein n=1 Tax=Phyllosticta citriasiana TaxID=595635 RepID=UPI0030FD5333